jgi:hypothetical protein
LAISGSGVRKEHSVTVGELEFMQNYIFTGEYCLAKNADEKECRQLPRHRHLRIHPPGSGLYRRGRFHHLQAADGFSKTFPLEEIAKRDYINEESGAGNLKVMLAYGKNEMPLVPTRRSEG